MHTKTLAVSTAVLAALMLAAPAFADEDRGGPSRMDDRDRMATTVPERVIGERAGLIMGLQSLFRRNDDKRNENASAPKIEIGGKVSAVSSSAFSIEIPALRERATSTASIVVNASTTFSKKGSESASLSDVSVGSFVQVKGLLTSTSTMTITALRVDIASGTPKMTGEKRGELKAMVKQEFEDGDASSTQKQLPERVRNLLQSIFSRFGGLFGR